ncbi:MAG: hypothetical protein JXA67_11130 [Micromonosporaceae bacterium]|nr:hypothetical protein [Micromonosporaceae bacterium]
MSGTGRPGGGSDNPGCHGDVLVVVEALRQLADRDPVGQLGIVADAERALARVRHALVAEIMLDPRVTASWADVGRALGVSRQAARKTYNADVEQAFMQRVRARRARMAE